jgi:hypothetical protein
MFSLASLAKRYKSQFEQQYAQQLSPLHRRALDKIIQCHTPQAGAILYHCEHCQYSATFYPSCGHRHCPKLSIFGQYGLAEFSATKAVTR